MIRIAGPLLAALLVPAALSAQGTGAVELTITGIRAEQAGTLLVELYDHASGWLTLDSARAVRRVPVSTDRVIVRFDSLPAGAGYAIAVVHDKNGNDKLDMRWFPFPKPKEGAGVSNDHMRMGRPKYEDARFQVSDTTTQTRITLHY
ncbi:MAG: DUF2141 domain-containing protein [Gemmatimonadales bacterium]